MGFCIKVAATTANKSKPNKKSQEKPQNLKPISPWIQNPVRGELKTIDTITFPALGK